jgi:cyclophilin family peptidyl-prolyl cis-trans isomerase/HEAT repeat protein
MSAHLTSMRDISTSTSLRAAMAAALFASGCASAPPAPAAPPKIPFEQKMAWMLRLEDQRILKQPPPTPPPADVVPVRGRRVATPPPPPVTPDLTMLITDPEARIRRRAALAIGRTGLREGVPQLTTALGDADPDVRSMAAFALGLIGDATGVAPLTSALADASPVVRGRAAEALGQIALTQPPQLEGAARTEAADAVGRVAAEYARAPAVSAMTADDDRWPAAPEAEAFRLAVYALVRLQAYEQLSTAVLDASGRPVTAWWPVAFALGRIEDPRAQPALLAILKGPGKYPVAFAARGLGVLKDAAAVDPLIALLSAPQTPPEVIVSAVRALAAIGEARSGGALVKLAEDTTDANIRLETVSALGTLHVADGLPIVQDDLTDPWPTMRAAAMRAAAAIDPERFVLVLSGMEPDPQWTVRAALADVLGSLPPGVAIERVRSMLQDEDRRVVPSVLAALSRLKAPDLGSIALAQLKEPDFVVRATAARLVGEVKPAGGVDALRSALTLAQGDAAIDARAAIIEALAEYGGPDAQAALKEALADKDWAVRVRASALLAKSDPSGDYRTAIRPVPGTPVAQYDDPQLIGPPYSPHAFIETAKGTIELELAVLDAPQTSSNFMTLARKGFFNGLQIHRVVPNFVVQDGDPRGDGEGGPGYTIRDELNERPFVRGTLGMALSWKDTGGSQFFITHSPQPHLDARYTAFGHVVNGMDVVDRIQQGDTIQRVRVWDGKSLQ